jgi:hypothetical protein
LCPPGGWRLAVILLAMGGTTPARAGVFAAGNFAKCTTNPCTSTVAHGLGVTPKALIFWTSSKTTAAFGGGYQFGFGVSDTTTSASLGVSSQDAVTTSNSGRRLSQRAITLVNVGGSAATSEATVLSVDATNFSLQWSPNDTTAALVHFVAVGGADVSAKVVNWTMGTATGNRAVTGVGFKPDVVLHGHAGTAITAAPPGNATSAVFGLGVMDADGDQWATSNVAVDNVGTSDTQRSQTASNCLLAIDNALAIAKQANWVSMDNDGFTVNFNNATNANAAQLFSLALKGVNVKPGAFAKSTGAATATNTINGLGFTPRVVMLAGTFQTALDTPAVHSRFGLGAGDGTTQGSAAIQDTNALAVISNDGTDRTTLSFVKVDNNTPAVDAAATVGNFTAGSFDVSWTTNDAVATQVLYLALGSLPATAVRMVELSASASGRGALVRWTTGYEVDNLGFRVYREQAGRRIPLGDGLVAGSALFTGTAAALSGGRTYTAVDSGGGLAGTRYWIEELDLHGQRIWHGPIVAAAGDPPLEPSSAPRSLSLGAVATGAMSVATAPRALSVSPARDRGAVGPWSGAGLKAVKVGVRQAGWVRVIAGELLAAGLDPTSDPRRLRLLHHGRELPMAVAGEQDGRLDPTDAVEFFGDEGGGGEAAERVYWVVPGDGPGVRLPRRAATAGGATPTSFLATLTREDHLVYFPAVTSNGRGNFYGAVVAERPVVQTLTAPGVADDPAAQAELTLTLQGATDTAHSVDMTVNGRPLGGLEFVGRRAATFTRTLPQRWLHEGDNVVQLVRRGGDTDVTLVQTLTLRYRRRFHAVNDELEFAVTGRSTVTLRGFARPDIRVVALSGTVGSEELPVQVARADDGSYVAEVHVDAVGGQRLYAFTSAAVRRPASLTANRPSAWSAPHNGADLVLLGPADLLSRMVPLRAARERAGLSVASIDAQDAYDELGYGEKSTLALRELLRLASASWSRPPRYVLLVGDASFDPQGYLGLGAHDLVPTRLVDTRAMQTASDDWFVDFDEDSLPELAIGRLPARSPTDVDVMVAKILGAGGSSAARPVLLVADRNDEFDFQGPTRRLGTQLLGNFPQRSLFRGLLDAPQTTAQLANGLADGAWLVHYFGHGAVEQWAGGTLTSTNAPTVTRHSDAPLVLAMTCLNGYFHDVYTDSLGERLLKVAEGGASAVWASSGFLEPSEQPALEREFLRLLARDGATLGDAARGAKAAVGDPDLRRTWLLFGDPSQVRAEAKLLLPPSTRAGAADPEEGAALPPPDAAGCRLAPLGGLDAHAAAGRVASDGVLLLLAVALGLRGRRRLHTEAA